MGALELTAHDFAQAFEAIQSDNRVAAVEAKYGELEERLKAYTRESAKTKAQAILAGVGFHLWRKRVLPEQS